MDKYIYDEEQRSLVRTAGRLLYPLPCFTSRRRHKPSRLMWGQRHLHYLKEYRRGTYINLLTSGRLNAYLVKIDKQAQERFERLIEGMKRTQGITEQLKAENAFEWIRRTNNILACA